MQEYKGTRWYRCDFHLHTSSSLCFGDENKTAEAFIEKVHRENLDCIAITDHNTGNGIDAIKDIAKDKGITVFPGVEVTCSDAKIHILVLFDTDKGTTEVADFLIHLGLSRTDFGKMDAHVHKEVHEVLEEANNAGAIAIPAHIDENNGLSLISKQSKEKIFKGNLFGSVQIIHQPLLEKSVNFSENEELKNYLKEYYKKDVSLETAKKWYSCNEYICDIANVTFSDNPLNDGSPKHGLWGIGKKYTWIKMNENPSLEGIRQAFLVPSLRIKNCFESVETPYQLPATWIKSVTCRNTILSKKDTDIVFNFSPQMTTIIGGRGSGKSSILQFLRGLFNKYIDIKYLESIRNEFDDFYKFADRQKKGVFKDSSVLIVEIVKNEIIYRITGKSIKNIDSQDITIEKYDSDTARFIPVNDEEYLKLFDFDIYSQKQIYEVAQKINALRERIDSAIPKMDELSSEVKQKINQYLTTSAQIRGIKDNLEEKKLLKAELSEINAQINSYKESGIETLINQRQVFSSENEKIISFKNSLQEKISLFDEILESLQDYTFDITDISEELKTILSNTDNTVKQVVDSIKKAKIDYTINIEKLNKDIENSQWVKDLAKNKEEIEAKKTELGEKGLKNIDNFENLIEQKESKNQDIARLNKLEDTLIKEIKKRDEISGELLAVRGQITSARIKFLNSILSGQNVEIIVKPYRDKDSYEIEFRNIMQRPTGFEQSIEFLVDKCFKGKLPDKIKEIHKDLDALRKGEIPQGYDGHFKNCIQGLDDNQFVKLKLLLPEDEIFAQYKPSGSSTFKPISNASAGQKTSTILTFILSHGTKPLILDQPEDDLDNHLVYGLIVDRLRESKENRQVIVVTHNANIPVNGDSELIIAMDSESKYLTVFKDGTIEEAHIKKEICDVMEGGEDAFKLRSKRYEFLNA